MIRNFKHDEPRLNQEQLVERMGKFAFKFLWFEDKGYNPHYFQQLFHSLQNEAGRVLRFRHLVAGRRGGKTMSAAWEMLFYCLFPSQFHTDIHQITSDRPLHCWVLTKDYPTGRAAWRTFWEACTEAGLVVGRDYKMNKGERYFEFDNGSLVEFKTADDPESLRGAGLDILWMDEAAFILSETAYNVTRPALSDKSGIVISTTTPSGKNWFYDTFWSDEAMIDEHQGRVEYRSVDNPYFPRDEWEYIFKTYHPMLFKQEYMASFDSMAGKELHGDWLKYYTLGEEKPGYTSIPRKEGSKDFDLKYFIGVDPAISLSDNADRFVITLIGVTKDNTQVYLIDQWAGRIPFPDQVDKVQEWYLKWKTRGQGLQYIGVEAVAYQNALVQQLERLPSLPPIIPVFSKGKKSERILRMAPLFKIGKVRIRDDHRDFIDEWVGYDSELKNPKDDCLDSMEIALAAVGALLPSPEEVAILEDRPSGDVNELARRDLPGSKHYIEMGNFDESMGGDW
jgi:hypothetical protein